MGSTPLSCPECGNQWDVTPRADGSMPLASRCPKSRGGCGKLRKIPRSPASPGQPAAGWDPPSEPRRPGQVTEPCPHCGGQRVHAEPRGTVRMCPDCRRQVTPPGVLAPYQRGAEITRAYKSQRERDLEALDLAGRKGIMLAQLRAAAGDDRLDPASLPKVEWFADQVKTAAAGGRLDELAALWQESGIRPRRWWQGRPAAITAGYGADAEDGYAASGEDGEDHDDEPAARLATPAGIAAGQPQRATWADAFAAYGWRLAPADGSGICPVITSEGRCRQPPGGHPPVTDGIVPDGWPCEPHYLALGAACNSINQRRGIT